MNEEPIYIYNRGGKLPKADNSRLVGADSPQIRRRNAYEADWLESRGFVVEKGKNSNNAYFALKNGTNNHRPHEKEMARICAENGLSVTLTPEGFQLMSFENGKYQVSLPDGKIERLTIEMCAINGNPKADKFSDAIIHSRKESKNGAFIQADVAMTFAPKNYPEISRKQIEAGIAKYSELINKENSKIVSGPRYLMHIDERTRSVWFYRLPKVPKRKKRH